MGKFLFVFGVILLISGCSKTPESETAKKVGEQPRQIIDKVTADVNQAIQKDLERRQEAEKKE